MKCICGVECVFERSYLASFWWCSILVNVLRCPECKLGYTTAADPKEERLLSVASVC